MTQPDKPTRSLESGLSGLSSTVLRSLNKLLKSYSAGLEPLFKISSALMLPPIANSHSSNSAPRGPLDSWFSGFGSSNIHNLTHFFQVPCEAEDMQDLMADLLNEKAISAAYIKPPASVPLFATSDAIGLKAPSNLTPDFSPRQGYLRPAPEGIDVDYATQFQGGRGTDVRIIDVEYGWQFSHEDLAQNQGGLVVGDQFAPFHDHGTSVLGIISADTNGFGVTGICPDASMSAVSAWMNQRDSTASAIVKASERLRLGDIMLLELHRPGPRFGFALDRGQQGFIPVEWWPDDLAAIQHAVSRGIIVVAAAGNGGEDLDDALYDVPLSGFPANWVNPFRRTEADSGAILVGAGTPPDGTHGITFADPDRSRLGFSNYGQCVDAQGWGLAVTTTGTGDLQGGPDEDRWYTDNFNGTSSAAPMVVGALACVQGILRWLGRPRLTPSDARDLLRSTGSIQQPSPDHPTSQHIGNRPDLREMLDVLNIHPGDLPVDPSFSGFDVP